MFIVTEKKIIEGKMRKIKSWRKRAYLKQLEEWKSKCEVKIGFYMAKLIRLNKKIERIKNGKKKIVTHKKQL